MGTEKQSLPETNGGKRNRSFPVLKLVVVLGAILLAVPVLFYLYVVVAWWLDPPCFVCL